MKKLIYICMIVGLLTACTTPMPKHNTPTVKPTPPPFTPPDPPGPDKEDPIKPEMKEVFFGAKGDTVVVNTAGDFWDMELFMGDDVYLLPINKTRDTIESSWSKAVVLPHTAYIDDSGTHRYLAKQIKIIVFDNDTGKERWCEAELYIGNNRTSIEINQSAE